MNSNYYTENYSNYILDLWMRVSNIALIKYQDSHPEKILDWADKVEAIAKEMEILLDWTDTLPMLEQIICEIIYG